MAKLSARDFALIIASAAIGGAAALAVRLPSRPDENNMLGLVGSLIGAAIAVVAGLIVLARQFETNDERHLRTMRQLLTMVQVTGRAMQNEDAALDPAKHVGAARRAFQTAKSVSKQLQAAGAHIATVAQMLDDSALNGHLSRMSDAGPGVAGPDVTAKGQRNRGPLGAAPRSAA